MTQKLTGREVYDALREQRQGHPGEYNGNRCCKPKCKKPRYNPWYLCEDCLRAWVTNGPWIDGKICFDALARRLNEIIVGNGNHDAVVRAVTGED